MLQDFYVSNDFCDQKSNNNQNFQFPLTDFMNIDFDKIRFQCNLKLLQKKIIMLFGFPSIKVDSQRIYQYLKGIQNQNHFEQLKKIRTLVSFLGEVTYINNWNDRVPIIKARVQQFFTIQDLEIKWSEEQWKKEIDSIITDRINNYYYDDTFQNKTFSYVNLFQTLQIKLPTGVKDLNHHSFNSIQTSKLLEDFHILCDIDEFYTIRNIRNFILNITNKLNDFMNLLIDIEIKQNLVKYYIRNRYQTLCEQLQDIIKNFTSIISQEEDFQIYKKQKLKLENKSFEKFEELAFETQTLTTSKTTIIQGVFDSKSKQQKKKIKLEKHLHYRSSIIYSISQGENSSEFNNVNQSVDESQIKDNEENKDLISLLQNQLINNNLISFRISQIFDYSLEKFQQKILTYEYILYQFEQLGYPCIILEENELLLALQDYKLHNLDHKNLIVKLFNIISESFISKNGSIDFFQQLQDKVLKYLQQIPIDIPIQELNSIQKEQCILKSNMSIYDNLSNKKFSYHLLSQIINRKFPDEIYKIQCSSTKIIFQHWNIQPLLDIFNFQDLKNIRVTQYYIHQIYTCLQVLINFKESFQNNFDQETVQDFIKMEKQFIDVINQPLNFHVDSNQYLKSLKNVNQLDDIFWQKFNKSENIQVQELPKLSISNHEKKYGQLKSQKNQDEKYMKIFDYQIREDYFESPKFSFINKPEQQFQDQYINEDEAQYSGYFSQ